MHILRDNRKDEKYFEELIHRTENDIEIFESLIYQVIDERGKDDEGVKNGYNILINSYIAQINLLYSAGRELETIKEKLERFLKFYCEMWDMQYGYIELVRVLSLVVLFDIDVKFIKILEDKINSEGLNDFLVDFLLKYVDGEWQNTSDEFVFKGIYDDLQVVIESNINSVPELLRVYLEEKWYSNHSSSAWYDSHKSRNDVYYGYWSYEAGAIAKIMHINDVELKQVSYYPYDLVHYGE